MARRMISDAPFYYVHKAIIEDYAKMLGPYGLSVYSILCYHENTKTSECFPSAKTIAQILGISEKSVFNQFKKIRQLGLADITSGRKGKSNRFLLNSVGAHTAPSTERYAHSTASEQSHVPTNKNKKQEFKNDKTVFYKSLKPEDYLAQGSNPYYIEWWQEDLEPGKTRDDADFPDWVEKNYGPQDRRAG